MHQDKKKQQNETVSDKKSSNEKLGGFMASIHEVEETIYGPESPLDGKTKVFLCIRHKIIRDWKRVKAIPKNEIIEATGIDRRNFDRAVKILEKSKMIISHKTKTGLLWNPTLYALHPQRFPNTLWCGGEKEIELSNKNQTHEVSHDAKIIPISRKKGGVSQTLSDDFRGVSQTPASSVSQTPRNELKFSELLEKIDAKNPLKKKKNLKNPGEIEELNTLSVNRDQKEMLLWMDETNGLGDFEEWRKRRA